MIKALAHVCILSTDLERTRHFYCDILGLEQGFRFLRDGRLFGFYLKVCPDQFIEVFHTDSAPSGPAKLITHFCLEVEDITAMHARLVEAGIAVKDKLLGADHSWQIWCKDPDGVDIEFHQYTSESTQLTGRDCHVNW